MADQHQTVRHIYIQIMPLSRENTSANIAAVKKKQAEEELELEASPRSSRSIEQEHKYTMGAAESSEVAGPKERKFEGEQSRQDEENVYVSLTYDPLDATKQMARVKSAKAGAVVLFAGKPYAVLYLAPLLLVHRDTRLLMWHSKFVHT